MLKVGVHRAVLTSLIALVAMGLLFACAPAKKPQVAFPPPPPPGPPNVYIEVNLPAMEMTVYEEGKAKFVKPIAIGSGVYPTPAQEAEIKKIEWNPWWYPPPAEWAKNDKPTPPGPGNPLGLVKMALSDGILFHGTNKEKTVGTPASHGCLRMFNADATEVAWYLQTTFSDKTDPALRETYKKNRRTTYVVQLDQPVPVGLIYKPVILRGSSLLFFPDYYKKLLRKEAAIKEEILASGAAEQCVDEAAVKAVAKDWPKRGTEIPVKQLLATTCN